MATVAVPSVQKRDRYRCWARRGSVVAGRTWGARLSMDPAEENSAWVDHLVLVPSPPDKYHLLLQKRRRSVRRKSLRGE